MGSIKKENNNSPKARGGYRPGAGRPVGKGRVKGEPTQMMRIPISKKEAVKQLIETEEYQVPFFSGTVRAGIPTNVPDEHPDKVGIVNFITDHPEDTYFVTAQGDSMINANIFDGDILVVDTEIEITDKAIVVAAVDNDQTVKRYRVINGKTYLFPENENYKPIDLAEHSSVQIWGVVKKKIGVVG